MDLTTILETMRQEKRALLKSEDCAHIHHRKIVNVIIKGRQLRKGIETDVYLHVYHPEWKEYHLIGLNHKDNTKTDEAIAQLALEKQVGLKPDQYILDPNINPKEKEITLISKTSGALTKYTFCVRTMKEIKVPLKLKDWMDDEESPFGRNWFRWFTFEEIKQRRSYQGEAIMESTPHVMDGIDLAALPVSAHKAQDARVRIGIRDEIRQHFSIIELFSLMLITIISLVLVALFPTLFSFLEKSIPVLENVLRILTVLLGILGPFVYAIYKGSRK